MTTTGTPEDDTSVLLVLVLLGAEPQNQNRVQHIELGLLYVRDDIELITSVEEAGLSVTTAETN